MSFYFSDLFSNMIVFHFESSSRTSSGTFSVPNLVFNSGKKVKILKVCHFKIQLFYALKTNHYGFVAAP